MQDPYYDQQTAIQSICLFYKQKFILITKNINKLAVTKKDTIYLNTA